MPCKQIYQAVRLGLWHLNLKLTLPDQDAGASVAGDSCDGAVFRTARLLRSAVSHPDGPYHLTPSPRGSLSSLVAVPLPTTAPLPHQVGDPSCVCHLCLHAGERVICSNTYKDRLAISLKVGNQPYEVLSTGQIKLLGLLCSAFTQLKLLHSKPTSLRQEASHSKWQWLGSSLQACHFPLILGMLVSSAA